LKEYTPNSAQNRTTYQQQAELMSRICWLTAKLLKTRWKLQYTK